MSLDQAILNRKILVTCGTGGVGKTTLSAAIAVRAAVLGRKTAVITIDPAKRLATSLGLHELDDHPTDLTSAVHKAWEHTGRSGGFEGTLDAIVPDTRRTFEKFIASLARSPAVAKKVLDNPIFHTFAQEFSGANEYMALEKLYSIHQLRQYDLIVLDTPPSRNTMAFLDAPQLLARFFEEKLIRWLVLPANRLVSAGMRKAFGLLERLTGSGFMGNLLDFASSLIEVQEEFTQNLREVNALLRSKDVGFVMVTGLAPDTTQEAINFINKLRSEGFQFEGVAANRTLSYLQSEASAADFRALEPGVRIVRELQDRENRVLEELRKNGIKLCAQLPELARDVHSVEDLFHVAMALDPNSVRSS